jgi:uncharacterized repeat protein (TIGR03803 family)
MNLTQKISPANPLSIPCGDWRFSWRRLTAAILRSALSFVVIAALLVVAAPRGACQTDLYDFTGGSDGRYPSSRLTFDGVGNLYGTTESGGLGFGTVFELSPDGHGGWNESVIYSFSGGLDGANPTYSPVIFDNVGNLYGTAYLGGAKRQGVVFRLTPTGGGGWNETVLHSFIGSKKDGGNPRGAIVLDAAGNIYGTTNGGNGTRGCVFELSPAGGDAWMERILYGVEAGPGGLAMDATGNLFGTSRDKKVFELSPDGKGGWNARVIYIFEDGSIPLGTLAFDDAGNLFGTTYPGGAFNAGTVYKLSRGQNGWNEDTLQSFQRHAPNAFSPFAGLVLDAAGNIYGTTLSGGTFRGGTVFELVAGGGGSYTLNIVANLRGAPYSGVIRDGSGNLYGTTNFGGSQYGVVYEATP